MTNEDYKALGLPLYEDMVHAFQETDHYNICHKTSEEWVDGAEWARRIAVDAIKAKEKEWLEKACEYFDWFLQEKVTTPDYLWVCKQVADFRKAMKE